MKKTLAGLILSILIAMPAWAAPVAGTPQSEMLYRVNLGRADDVKLLLDQGVSPNLSNDEGIPLLSLAANRRDEEGLNIIKVLLAAGADVNGTDTQGRTALFVAAKQGNKTVVMYLLEQKINYYIADHNGDIARNLAHREGHKDIVTAMDDFVKNQGEQVKKQYEDINRTLQERYDAERKAKEGLETEQAQQAQKEFDDAMARSKEIGQKQTAEYEALKEKQEAERQALIDKRNTLEFEQQLRDLSFQTCAFQYWSFCKNLNQTTEISGDEVDVAISTHEEEITRLTEHLVSEYQLKRSYLNNIINGSKKRIFKLLNKMPSKTYRFEHGIGKLEDVRTRCDAVAKYWSYYAEANRIEAEEDADEDKDNNKRDTNKNRKKRRR